MLTVFSIDRTRTPPSPFLVHLIEFEIHFIQIRTQYVLNDFFCNIACTSQLKRTWDIVAKLAESIESITDDC